MKIKALRWLVPALIMGIIFYLSSQPKLDGLDPAGLLNYDKLVHLFAYFVLSAALWYPLMDSKRVEQYIVLISIFYGASDEWHQSFVPGRSCDIKDFLADTVGTILLISVVCITRRISYGRNKKRRTKNTGA